MLPTPSPSFSPSFPASTGTTSMEYDDIQPIDITGSTATLDLAGNPSGQAAAADLPLSPIPPLDLGVPYIRGRACRSGLMVDEPLPASGVPPEMPADVTTGMPSGMASGMASGLSSGVTTGISSGMPPGMASEVAPASDVLELDTSKTTPLEVFPSGSQSAEKPFPDISFPMQDSVQPMDGDKNLLE